MFFLSRKISLNLCFFKPLNYLLNHNKKKKAICSFLNYNKFFFNNCISNYVRYKSIKKSSSVKNFLNGNTISSRFSFHDRIFISKYILSRGFSTSSTLTNRSPLFSLFFTSLKRLPLCHSGVTLDYFTTFLLNSKILKSLKRSRFKKSLRERLISKEKKQLVRNKSYSFDVLRPKYRSYKRFYKRFLIRFRSKKDHPINYRKSLYNKYLKFSFIKFKAHYKKTKLKAPKSRID